MNSKNKFLYDQSVINSICNSFNSYLKMNIKNKNNVQKIIEKGEKIIQKMEEIENNKDRKALMVGHVQSGKTMNFLSVISSAIKHNYQIIIIFTSYENKLHNQTVERVKKAFDEKNNINNLKIYNTQNGLINENQLSSNIKSNFISVFLVLKQKIKDLEKLLSRPFFQDLKILIVDDEGDLGSMTHTKKSFSKTYLAIEKLLNNLNKYIYLSVTATPQVHIATSHMKLLFPKKVFCIDPGENYVGLDYFMNDDNLKRIFVVDKNNISINNKYHSSWITNEFKEAVQYYIIVSSFLLKENILKESSHMNMLVHRDVKKIKHSEDEYSLKQFLESMENTLNRCDGDYSKNKLLKNLQSISDKYKLNINVESLYNSRKLQGIIKRTQCLQINQNNNNEINGNLSSILIGSKKLERGITIDNLLVTYFTNRAKQTTAIDTLLQRARWFGYRDKVIEYIKIFTTQKILDDFKVIVNHNKVLWQILKKAEEDDENFETIDTALPMTIISQGSTKNSIVITNKAPFKRKGLSQRTKIEDIEHLSGFVGKVDSIINNLFSINEFIYINNYKFKNITLNCFKDLYQFIDENEFSQLLKIDLDILRSLEKISNQNNYKIKISLLTNQDGTSRERKCSLIDINNESKKYKIDQIYQGRNDDGYVGDAYWHDVSSEYDKTIFIQLHKIIPLDKNKKSINNIEYLYAPALIIPKEIDISIFNRE